MANKNNAKYKEEYIKEADKYLALKKDGSVRVARKGIRKTGKYKDSPYTIYDTKFKVNLPTIVGFATHLGVVKKTLNNWGKAHKDFKVALNKIKSEQKQRLINMGLSGDYNPTIAKLLLSANHGMKERIDKTTDDQPINNFDDEQVDRIADRIARRKSDNGDSPSPKILN